MGFCGELKVSDRLWWWEGGVCEEVIWKSASGQESEIEGRAHGWVELVDLRLADCLGGSVAFFLVARSDWVGRVLRGAGGKAGTFGNLWLTWRRSERLWGGLLEAGCAAAGVSGW